MMDEKAASDSCMLPAEGRTDSLYSMYFGVSCTFALLKLLSRPEFDNMQWFEVREEVLKGCARLFGIMVWKIQRREFVDGTSELLYKLRNEVEELRTRRREDAKANEKVVSIYASREQSWLSEKRVLKHQIDSLFNELQAEKRNKEETALNLNEKLKEKDTLIQTRDKALEEAAATRKEIEEKLQRAEAVAGELRDVVNKEAQKHNSEIWKHKTAFIELVSNQRQLEAEMGRALRQVEVAKQELDPVMKQKEEAELMVQQLSVEVIKTRKDADQKEKVLSAMLRKSKLDTAEKEMLLREVRISKAKRKQAQLEMEKYRTLHESKHERNSSKSNSLSRNMKSEVSSGVKGVHSIDVGYLQNKRTGYPITNGSNPRTLLFDYMEIKHKKEWRCFVPEKTVNVVPDGSIHCQPEREQFDYITADVSELEGWVRMETEKNTTLLEQKHQIEINAFAEQLRLKDEKLEAFRWQLLSMELELKGLLSQNEELDKSMSELRKENMKLDALLMGHEAELKALNKSFASLRVKTSNSWLKNLSKDNKSIWSDVKIIKTNQSVGIQTNLPLSQEVDAVKEEQIPTYGSDDTYLILEAPAKDIEVETEVALDTGHLGKLGVDSGENDLVTKSESYGLCFVKTDSNAWKNDICSLGVSNNIKRLKQQLLLLDKLVGMSKSSKMKEFENNSHFQTKGFVVLMSLLNKQVSRYQSLQEKIDDLCKRMQENDASNRGGSKNAKTKKDTKVLEISLQETLQLQRFMVATGQKLMEMQSKITSGFISSTEETYESSSFDMRRFAESVTTIFKEVQKGLEVRIARIIGDIEETLTCEGIEHS